MGYTIYIKHNCYDERIDTYSFSYTLLEDIVCEEIDGALTDSWKIWWVLRYGETSLDTFLSHPFHREEWDKLMLCDADATMVRVAKRIPVESYHNVNDQFKAIANRINQLIDQYPDTPVKVIIR